MNTFCQFTIAGIFSVFTLTACIDNGNDSIADVSSQASNNIQVSGIPMVINAAGIKGPLAHADIKIYAFDPAFPEMYNRHSPIALAISDQFAQVSGLSVPSDTKPPYILTIGGSQAIDLNTGMLPVIETLTTVITSEMLASNKTIYATPLTTLAYQMARSDSGSETGGVAFENVVERAGLLVSERFALDPEFAIDIFSSPLLINDKTDTRELQEEAVYHRAALEAFSAYVYQLSLDGGNQKKASNYSINSASFNSSSDLISVAAITANYIIQQLAIDLQSDGVIDDSVNGSALNALDINVFNQTPMQLVIPNTSYRIKDTLQLMEEERTATGNSRGPQLLVDVSVLTTRTDEDESSGQNNGSTEPFVELPIRVNIGGGVYTDVSGNLWIADTGCRTSGSFTSSVSILGTRDEYLFQSHRWGNDSLQPMTCSYQVDPGEYLVNLYFSETNKNNKSVGKRVFYVSIEDTVVLDDIDIFKETGVNTALLKTVTTLVNDGKIDISFRQIVGKSQVKAIEILRAGDGNGSPVIVPVNKSPVINIPDPVDNTSYTIPLEGLITTSPSSPDILLYHDFNDEPLNQSYSQQYVKNIWNAHQQLASNKSAKVVSDPDPKGTRGKVMRAFYAANTIHNRNDSGFYWRKRIGSHNELYFAYDVYFEKDAEFTKGGKLPGLGIENYFSAAGERPDGTDRWTGGLSWYAGGKISSYVYHADQPGEYGHNIKWDDGNNGQVYFKRGEWNRVEIYYKMNTPGVKNGRIKGWLNGKLALDSNAPMYRMPGGEHLTIGAIAMASMYGGDQSFAPSKDQYIYFDNFVISTKPITH